MKHWYFFVLIALAMAGCRKDDTPTQYVPKELKDLYLFRPGSYWTMRDSLTGRIDSFFVTRVDSSISRYSTGYFEDNYVNIREVNVDGTNTADSAYYGFHLQGAGNSFAYNDFINKEEFSTDGFSFVSPKIDFNLNGLSYYDVVEIYDREVMYVNFHNSDGVLYPSTYYLNAANGFIKMRFNTKYHHFAWELLHAHIIR